MWDIQNHFVLNIYLIVFKHIIIVYNVNNN